jgi:hypothetical protein
MPISRKPHPVFETEIIERRPDFRPKVKESQLITSIRLRPDLWGPFHAAAKERDISKSALACEAIEQWLDRQGLLD